MSVLSAYCVFILLHCVLLCSVVFLYSLSAPFCLPVLTSGPFFSVWGFVPPLVFRHCPHFVEVLSSCLFWGFVLIFYIEALSSYFILRLCPHLLYWGFVLLFYFEVLSSCLFWGFVLIFYIEASSSFFYIEASSSYFILRLCPHLLYWGFVLNVLFWGYVSQFEALVLIVVGPCYFVCTAYLICLQWYVCGSVCLYFCLG